MPEDNNAKQKQPPMPDDVIPILVWRKGVQDPVRILSDAVSWQMLQQRIVNDGLVIQEEGNAYLLDSPPDDNGRRTRFIFSDATGFAGSEVIKR